jgi:hypothetical protein
MKKTAFYLIALLGILLSGKGAMAQGGLAPLVNSTHTYSVTAGNAGNTFAWTIVEGSSPTDYVITGGTTTTASILWKKAGTYTLQFRETASTSCITLISKTVVVSANTFDVTTPALLSPLCNEASGVANYASSTVATTVQYTVNMATGIASYNPNWEFSFTLTGSAGATLSAVASSAGSISGTGPYTVSGLTSASGTGTTTITLELTGDVNAAHTVAIAITSAKETSYNTPSNNTGNKNATQTVNAIPATTAFSSN